MGSLVDDYGITLCLGEAGGDVDHIRIEPPRTVANRCVVLMFVGDGGREISVRLSAREVGSLTHILSTFIR